MRVSGAGVARSPPRFRVARPECRDRSARRWRQRREKGQVAAVATILGLLIIVTFIANYISTTLPSQMAVNDQNRGILVQNEVGRLDALMQSLAESGQVGLQVSQPITLGSDAAPPFAGSDGATVSGADPYANLSVAFSLTGPPVYSPPSGGIPNAGRTTGCTLVNVSSASTLTCAGGASAYWNYSSTTLTSYTVSTTGGGGIFLNVTASSSTIALSSTGGTANYLVVIGSHDSISVGATGGFTSSIIVFGSFDNLTLSTTAASVFHVLVVGNNNGVSETHSGALTVNAAMDGSSDTFAGATSGGSSTIESVYFTGYNVANPTSSACPYDNDSSTDTVSGGASTGTYSVSYNNTVYAGTAKLATYWNAVYHKVVAPFSLCPFYNAVHQTFDQVVSSGLVVQLSNTYSPAGTVALDNGMVVVAQPGGTPLSLDAPAISYAGSTATLLLTSFVGTFSSDAGVGTGVLSLRMLSDQMLSSSTSGLTITNGTDLVITIHSQFAAAWQSYFAGSAEFAGLSTCSGPAVACNGPYTPNGPVGTVVLSLPATTATIQLATFVPSLA